MWSHRAIVVLCVAFAIDCGHNDLPMEQKNPYTGWYIENFQIIKTQ